MAKPHFTIKNRFQKRPETYEEILTPSILADVCQRITGQGDYTVEFDNSDYNKGRLATLAFNGCINYVSFSVKDVESRNSSFQSFPSALVKFLAETNRKKKLYFYFLPSTGNFETPYFIFMYRLMRTAGTVFPNYSEHLAKSVRPFNSVEDLVMAKDAIRERNRGNKSTYVTKDESGTLQIYGKTYGANKYETTLLCVAISMLSSDTVELYEITEGNLTSLPQPARQAIQNIGNIKIIQSNLEIERREYEDRDSLRSPTFIYNLLERFGDKRCALCDCEIPELIQGAHIWPVAAIKRVSNISQEKKLEAALDGNNGMWLCNNHHKLFDVNLIMFNQAGRTKCVSALRKEDEEYVRDVTVNRELPAAFLTAGFLQYLHKRNSSLDESQFDFIQ